MKLSLTKLNITDFNMEDRKIVEGIAGTLNPFIDDMMLALNKNITVQDNLPFEFRTLDITVDVNGTPINNGNLSTSLRNFKGYICLNVIDLSGSKTYPTSQPFISFEVSNNIITIRNITGLTAGIPYRLTLLGIS